MASIVWLEDRDNTPVRGNIGDLSGIASMIGGGLLWADQQDLSI